MLKSEFFSLLSKKVLKYMLVRFLQKTLSFSLIVFLLFATIFQVPTELFLASSTYADEKEFYNLVSIVVDEETYDQTKTKLVRYARDIQGVLENTRAVIIPTPSDSSVHDIASLNEALYNEGYISQKDVDFDSRLIGTVLVGKIPVPLVFESGKSARTILPYVDFFDKAYIYNPESEKYEKNQQSENVFDPEVWHGVISPNTGDQQQDIEQIGAYLDKNHDFYLGQGMFAELGETSSDHEPYVFYYDQFRENAAIQYQSYMGYQMYLENIEDIAYNRYSKDLAKKVKDSVLGAQNRDLADLIRDSGIDLPSDLSLDSAPDENMGSDIASKYITDGATKKFLEIFNGTSLGEMREHVFHAGRYNTGGSSVNMDMPPLLVTVLDEVSREVIKNANTALENEITDLVANGLSRNIPLNLQKSSARAGEGSCQVVSHAFYYGKIASDIESARECSIYRGSMEQGGTLVEANRAYNINNTQSDLAFCDGDFVRGDSTANPVSKGYWGGNTPLNFNLGSEENYGDFQIQGNNLNSAIVPLFDNLGTKQIDDPSRVPSPLDCYNAGMYIETYGERQETRTVGNDENEREQTYCVPDFQAPVLGKARFGEWSCRTNNITSSYTSDYEDKFLTAHGTSGECAGYTLNLNGNEDVISKRHARTCRTQGQGDNEREVCSCGSVQGTINYKSIPSYILHTSPTDEEFGLQSNSLFTPSLPIDQVRYIDYIGANGQGDSRGYQRIDFPQLFSLRHNLDSDVTLESSAELVKEYLAGVSQSINRNIQDADPSVLSGGERALYESLGSGEYPQANFDLTQILQNKPLQIQALGDQQKEVSYFDTLVFAVYWNNLPSAAAKYKFIFTDYLSGQFYGNDYNFLLPKNKNIYETAYIAAPGDSQNMYIKLDPERKLDHPYSDVISKNLELQTLTRGAQLSTPQSHGTFECAPPDGVPIWQWIPAVVCWLKDMLPPTIKIGHTDCGEPLFDEDELIAIEACSVDDNENGIVDCFEQRLIGGSLLLESDADRYYYQSSGILSSTTYENTGDIAKFDSQSRITHELVRLEVVKDLEKTLSDDNLELVYDASSDVLGSEESLEDAQKYFRYRSLTLPSLRGKAQTYFSSRQYDVNAYFVAKLELAGRDEKDALRLESNVVKVSVRGDRIILGAHSIDDTKVFQGNTPVLASSQSNICVIDGTEKYIGDYSDELWSISDAPEKLLLSLENISKTGQLLDLNYPLSLKIMRGETRVFEQENLSYDELQTILPLFGAETSGRYSVHVRDSVGFVSTKTIDVRPDSAQNIETILSTNFIETGGNISTHLVNIFDQYQNSASGEVYILEMDLAGGGLVFEQNGDTSIRYNVLDGYKAFQLQSTQQATQNTLTVSLKNLNEEIIDTQELSINTLGDIQLQVTQIGDTPKVGGDAYQFDLTFTDAQGDVLTNLFSRSYMSIDTSLGNTQTPYSTIENGTGSVIFSTSQLASENVEFEFQLEGSNELYRYNSQILPEDPLLLHLYMNRDKIEASSEDFSILEVVLKDVYGNEVFTDSQTKITSQLAGGSENIIRFDEDEKIVNRGKVQFEIFGKSLPGTGHFTVSSEPDLNENSFDLPGQAPFELDDLQIPGMKTSEGVLTELGQNFFLPYGDERYISRFVTLERLRQNSQFQNLPNSLQEDLEAFWDTTNSLEIRGYGHNAGSLETFYFWNSEEIDTNAYNALYSVLLGGEYGNIAEQNYLAGGMLFDRDNVSLSATTLLDSPFSFSDVIHVQNNSGLELLSNDDLTQDIHFDISTDSDGRLKFSLFNDVLSTHIGDLYYNLSQNSEISVNVESDLYYAEKDRSGDVSIYHQDGYKILDITESGRFTRYAGLHFDELSATDVGELEMSVFHNSENLGTIAIRADLDINVTRDETVLGQKLNILQDTILIHLRSHQYGTRRITTQTQEENLYIYYKDPFADNGALSSFHDGRAEGIESIQDEKGIGWEDANMMMLDFSGGALSGEASERFQSFSLIHLGDPVLQLPKKRSNFHRSTEPRAFDSTLGVIIDEGDDLIGYQTFDYNNDQRIDILTIHSSGKLGLLEGSDIHGGFIDHGDFGYAADGGSLRFIKTGDFTGDGFDDIFFLSDTGEPQLFNNKEKDIERVELFEQMTLEGRILQVEVFDMDNDTVDDIVTLDEEGSIHIFYGGGSEDTPEFTKLYVGDGYHIQLDDSPQSFGGAIYFDGIAEVGNQDAGSIQTQYLENLADATNSGSTYVDPNILQNFVYLPVPYLPTDYDGVEANVADIIAGQGGSYGEGISESLTEFLEEYQGYTSYDNTRSSFSRETYFLRSQYSDTEGLDIQKTFRDTTPEKLKTGDSVMFEITFTNTGADRLDNIAYVDRLPEYFTFANDQYKEISQREVVRKQKIAPPGYSLLIDEFFLEPDESVTVSYELVTLPLSYGHMQVGIYEQEELGEDEYGDVILKQSDKNCGKTAKIFRSDSVRNYSEGETSPSCEGHDVTLGDEHPELRDENGNGIPDYLEGVIQEDGSISDELDGTLQKYLQDARDNLQIDTDGDGIPDQNDALDNTSAGDDFMATLESMNSAIDDIADGMDEIIEGLSCGFGGGSCFATPLNWAPLAPGNDPTLFGTPIGDGLHVNEGIPVFSALTGQQASCGFSPCCLPSVYPMSSQAFVPGPFCGPDSAGGSKGTWASTNFVRMFITPTFTGSVGIAVCFGGPAAVAGNTPPPGVSPIAPGGNCIVAAMPLMACEGGEGNPGAVGYPEFGDVGVIHANCDGESQALVTPAEIQESFIQDYFSYLRTGQIPGSMKSKYRDLMQDIGANPQNYTLPSRPLFNIGGGGSNSQSIDINLDVSALTQGNFDDVIDIQNKRIGGFPGFMMDWVDRQLDEITSKLTNLPKIYVILPDFGGIFDSSGSDFSNEVSELRETEQAEYTQEKGGIDNQISALRQQKSGLDCIGDNALRCRKIDIEILALQGQSLTAGGNGSLSGIKEVYEFIGSIPLVDIEHETIPVSIPWIDRTELSRFSLEWELTSQQWQDEITRAKNAWSFGSACNEETPAQQARCEAEYDVKNNAILEAEALLASLQQNRDVLEEYKRLPEKIATLINIKEVWLEQILCNIEALSQVMSGWIQENGERFKAWVELYILIKAILKSWQGFIDVFLGYEEECHQCKNERQDLQNFTFGLVSAVIPSPPIIEFPKWPDIILDFHHIRMGMTIYMPEFEIDLRPIVLPTLPDLRLPDTPTATLALPELPILPMYELPELPELPALPTVELPNLPPPPKIPKLFGSVEVVLDIMKLVSRVMCILKSSPFVPEWRAGDQIAFMTERNGYLPTDYIDIQPPSFSYSAISTIKVTTYVNLEFETDAIIEAARAITAPLDSITNNIVHMFDLQVSDLDLRGDTPTSIDVDIQQDGTVDTEISRNTNNLEILAGMLAGKLVNFFGYLTDNQHITMDNREFYSYVSEQLQNPDLIADQSTKELRDVWSQVGEMRFMQEERFIDSMKDYNRSKFETLENILHTEIEYTKQQKDSLKHLEYKDVLLVNEENPDARYNAYATAMQSFNETTLDTLEAVVDGKDLIGDQLQTELQRGANNLLANVDDIRRDKLLAVETGSGESGGHSGGACYGNGNTYEYEYKGMYVLEDGKNYKLIDYTDMLRGDEKPELIDIDGDSDDDILYFSKGRLYMKENATNTPERNYITLPPLILSPEQNQFYNTDYIPTVNGFRATSSSDSAINIEFLASQGVERYHLGYNTLVDSYLENAGGFVPDTIQYHGIDMIDISARDFVRSGDYSSAPHEIYLHQISVHPGISLTQERFISIREKLQENTSIRLTKGSAIYTGNRSAKLRYMQGSTEKTLNLTKNREYKFENEIQIIGVSGDSFLLGTVLETLSGQDLQRLAGLPLQDNVLIEFDRESNSRLSANMSLRFKNLGEKNYDFETLDSYRYRELATSNDVYNLRIPEKNDFYYARMYSESGNIQSTLSHQELLAPQRFSDDLAPQFEYRNRIRIPVYQEQEIDFTPYVFEDGGLGDIEDVWIDFDLGEDQDNDGDSTNDRSEIGIDISYSSARIAVKFGVFDEIFERSIRMHIQDNNKNVVAKNIILEVYAPTPNIEDIQDTVIEGAIDEQLGNEPISLYRYRAGGLTRLEDVAGQVRTRTDIPGNFDFEASEESTGLTLQYEGATIASIDEFTGRIDSYDPFVNIQALSTNNPNNSSVFPEIRIMRLGELVFRQFMKIPEGEIQLVPHFNSLNTGGMFVKILDQENYSSYSVPLTASYNPGSLSVFATGSISSPAMTLLQDGQLIIDTDRYELQYETLGEDSSLVLIDTSTQQKIAQVVYHMQASYVLR